MILGIKSNRDKTKHVNKNQEIVYDGVVDNVTPKPAKMTFNLTDCLKEAKNAEKPPLDNKMSGNKLRNSWATRPK